MGFPDAELKIVSLIRYIDSCEPAHRHSDCPFAVEHGGGLTCHEECREVLKSQLRRGRSPAETGAQAFDARQLRLSEIGPTPDILWHTSSLLQVLVNVAQTPPFRRDGSFHLRRHVDATSALGVLGCRGLDPDKLVRRGLAKTLKLRLAGWLESRERMVDPQGDMDLFNRWREFFDKGATGEASPGKYIAMALHGKTAMRLNTWLESARLENVLCWKPPEQDPEPSPTESANEDAELWTWIVERFTETYLERWSLTSLQYEYRFVQGLWRPDLPEEILAERTEPREKVATALADRTLERDDVIDPATMGSLTAQSVSLLEEGQRREAAALWDAARRLKPADLVAQQNYAFCIMLDEPTQARSILEDVLTRGIRRPLVSLCNLALAESLLRNTEAAFKACEQAYEVANEQSTAYLWTQQREGEWAAPKVAVRRWIIRLGVELERSCGVTGDVWTERLDRLGLTEFPAPSADPSSAGTDEEDL